MKRILLFIVTIVLTGSSMAQSPVIEGNIIIDPYVGIPNWANSILYSNYDSKYTEGEQSNVRNYKVNGGMIGYGGRAEYLVADNFGVGLDVSYEVSGFNFDYDDVDTASGTIVAHNYDYTAKKIRVMLRMNYHFVQNDRVDAYFGFAGGYRNVNRTAYEENIASGQRTYIDKLPTLIPVAIRLAVGTRVYFTENIGAHVELGVFGGGLLQGGISAKF